MKLLPWLLMAGCASTAVVLAIFFAVTRPDEVKQPPAKKWPYTAVQLYGTGTSGVQVRCVMQSNSKSFAQFKHAKLGDRAVMTCVAVGS